ncbi:MAG: nucleoside-diphosphate kinase [Veillonellaceae bacterium]|nr:nucleoside-diphosphate kinase [Veillonellaceae bacterium]
MEKTLVLVKPDGVKRRLGGQIIARFEQRGLRIVALKLMRMSRALAEKHYAEHTGKPFFESLVDFITSGSVIAMVVEGENAIRAVRTMMGATNPLEAAPGTIRGDYALTMTQNVIHGSDAPASAEREISVFFSATEILTEC